MQNVNSIEAYTTLMIGFCGGPYIRDMIEYKAFFI